MIAPFNHEFFPLPIIEMAINPANGVLDIINGTLKVSSIDIKQAGGFTTVINTVARNDVLLYDDQDANTTFIPQEGSSYRSTTGVTRDTTSGAGYIDLEAGWVYWPLQLPNSWHTEFDMHVTTVGGVLTYSLFNTSEPNHTDYTADDGGYKIVFDNTENKIDVRWRGSVHATTSANLRSSDWQHVNINYFQGSVSIAISGKVVLTHKFTENYQEFDSRYVGFSATAGASHKIRHLRVHNSDKWLYTKTSNASDISYLNGNVGIGSLSPTQLLDVHGNVHIARDLTIDGNLTVSGTTTFIDTQNLSIEDPIIEVARGNASETIDAGLIITRPTSNVAMAYRGDEGELAIGYTQSGASGADVIPVSDGGLDVRVYGNLFANNLTTTANVEATYVKGDGSELSQITFDQVVGYGNTTANTIQLTNADFGLVATGNIEANYFIGDGSQLDGISSTLQQITNNGNTTSNTIQFTNATTSIVATSNVGIGTSVPTADLHVVGYQYVNDPPTQAASFDHSEAPLTLTHPTPTSTTAINDPKPVLHLTRDGTSGQTYGAKASFKMSRYENSGTASRSRLDITLADGTYAESNVLSLRADGNVGIGTTLPAYKLDVYGSANVETLSAATIYGTIAGSNTIAASTVTATTVGDHYGAIKGSNTIAASTVTATTVGDHYGAIKGSNTIAASTVTATGLTVNGNITVTGTVDGRDVATDGAKLDNILDSSKLKYATGYTEVNINAPDVVSGTWVTGDSDEYWGNPRFNNNVTGRYRYNDAPGYLEYVIPDGMKSAYISQLQWNSGGYVDVHGVQSDGGLVFLRRINTRQVVENLDEGNPHQHDGHTITFIGSGLETFSNIRLTNKVGRFHLDGLAFTPNANEGTEGTGMVHSGQISDLGSGIPTPTGTGASGTWGINISGTAYNQSGGTVSATTGSFSTSIYYPSYHVQDSLSGGGDVTWTNINGTFYLKWSARVIAIPVEKTEMGAYGYFDINCPTSGTITYFSGNGSTSTTETCTTNGIPITIWSSLYYVVTPGQVNTSTQANFRLIYHQNSGWVPDSNWILIATVNGDTNALEWLPGRTKIPLGGTLSSTYGAVNAMYANSAGNADTVDSLHASSFFRRDASNDVDVRLAAGDGRGLRFWDSDLYKIWMSDATNATWGGRLSSNSDYNMYFRMDSGTNRGFVFKNGTTNRCHITGDGDLFLNGGWLRTYGSTGLYNETYGGGWYMTDTTYIRAYNDKTIYTAGDILAGGTITAPTFSGNATSATSAGNANTVGGISANHLFNNMGLGHGTYTDFDAVPDAGSYYLMGSTNGPETSGQFYGFTLGLGTEYGPVVKGTNNVKYGCQIYWRRNTANPYIYTRGLENGAWGAWSKSSAGYADSANYANSAGSATTAGRTTNGGTIIKIESGLIHGRNYYYYAGSRTIDETLIGFSPVLAGTRKIIKWTIQYCASYDQVFRVLRRYDPFGVWTLLGYNNATTAIYSGVAGVDPCGSSEIRTKTIIWMDDDNNGSYRQYILQAQDTYTGSWGREFAINRPTGSWGQTEYEIGVSSYVITEYIL